MSGKRERHDAQAPLRVVIFDDTGEGAELLREGVERAGYRVIASLNSPMELIRRIDALGPDVIIIATDSPARDVLENLCVVSREQPRPIVMFTSEDDASVIRQAVRSGVSAYVVDGLAPERVRPIVEAALARFDELQRLKAELADVSLRLSERKVVERAKGILMQRRGMSEQQAFQALRSLAMQRKQRLGEVARHVIDMAEILS